MARRKKAPIEVELEIESWTKEGFGQGTYKNTHGDSYSVDVPHTIPGEKVLALLMSKRRGKYSSILKEVIKASPDRIEPKCAHFGSCGGCRWQHLPYSKQLERKADFVQREFAPLLENTSVEIEPIIPCETPWKYRNKMEFSFSENGKQTKFLGLMMAGGGGKVFNLTECHLVNPWFAETVIAVKKWWEESKISAYHFRKDEGSLRVLTVREGKRSGDRLVMLTVSGNPDYALSKDSLDSFVACLREALEKEPSPPKLSIFVRIHQIKKGQPTKFYEWKLYGPEFLRETLSMDEASLQFNVSPTSFFQPNTDQAENFYALALKMAGLSEDTTVFDLYCGTGTLGMLASGKAKRVLGIELSPESSLDARENVKDNHINNMEVITGDVGKTLTLLRAEEGFETPQLVVVDPPRVGLDEEALKNILDLSPDKILYISCNPATQAENIKVLTEEKYSLVAVRPVDQFPHTVHVENIAVLERNK
ncbi:MAG: 23S rRNA (uracil1939-C5)-methyltransferase [Chlamydiales bacterium]|jgi:23S rRNA (uracil1939-C5)-methyltransferase